MYTWLLVFVSGGYKNMEILAVEFLFQSRFQHCTTSNQPTHRCLINKNASPTCQASSKVVREQTARIASIDILVLLNPHLANAMSRLIYIFLSGCGF